MRFITETGSDWREVIGGILLCAPRPIQRYMDHRDRTSFTEARSLIMFVCLFFCYANLSNFAKGYRSEFSSDQAANFYLQSPRSNWISFLEIGGLGPPKGLFCPLKTPQRTKKLQLTTRNCVKHIPHGQTQFLVTKFLIRDTPEWSC